MSFCTYSQIGLLVENREIYIGLPQRYSTPCRNFALMFSAAKNRMIGLPHSGLPHDNGTGPLIILFLVLHFNFLFVPCDRLSWLPVSFLLHVKYTLSYRIVSYPSAFYCTLNTHYRMNNGTTYRHSFNEILIGTYKIAKYSMTRSVERSLCNS